jgi:hypothetical protein
VVAAFSDREASVVWSAQAGELKVMAHVADIAIAVIAVNFFRIIFSS